MHARFATRFLAACLFPLAASSHHSGAMFDRERTVSITGVVQEFLWNNPHSSIKLLVTERGAPVTWAIEMNGPNNLVHEGWKRTTLKAGDKVTLLVNPLRSGQPGGWYLSIRLPDGTTLGRPAGSGAAP
jgi:hypothetical protein